MNRNTLLLTIAIALAIGWNACSDVIVPDITGETVRLTSPPEGLSANNRKITFYWEALEDVSSYRLQVVSPSFDSIISLAFDTLITENRLSLTLQPGQYQWAVTGLNDAYETDSAEVRNLQVTLDSLDGLSQQETILQQPANNAFLNNQNVLFTWEPLPQATQYTFQVAPTPSFTAPITTRQLTENALSLSLPGEGAYYWRVRAESNLDNTFTNWAQRRANIDLSPPPSPALLLPTDGDSILVAAQDPDLKWSFAAGLDRDSVLLFDNPNLQNIYWSRATKAQAVNLDTAGIGFPAGEYYWLVLSIDKAGNISEDSEIRAFTVK
ncbi:MAG: hypothetical protein H6558_13460 [Lewinellaceae bacterium]|nr:hypothetical protein [Lewinellaceae bacterium]